MKYLLTAATVIFMGVIFCFSAQSADDSSEISELVGYKVCTVFVQDFEEMDEVQQLELVEAVDFPVRKCAHGLEYMILAVLCTGTWLSWLSKKEYFSGKRIYLIFLLGWMTGLLYAVSDEVHQIFVPGRACMIRDILIDAGGGAAGVIIFIIIYLSQKRRHQRSMSSSTGQ